MQSSVNFLTAGHLRAFSKLYSFLFRKRVQQHLLNLYVFDSPLWREPSVLLGQKVKTSVLKFHVKYPWRLCIFSQNQNRELNLESKFEKFSWPVEVILTNISLYQGIAFSSLSLTPLLSLKMHVVCLLRHAPCLLPSPNQKPFFMFSLGANSSGLC